MNIDEAKSAIRHARAGWTVPAFLATEAIVAVCDIFFDKKSSSRDKLRAVETLLAIERLNIELEAAKPVQQSPENRNTLSIVKLTSDEWRQCRELGITPQQLLGTEPLPPAPLSPQALLEGAA